MYTAGTHTMLNICEIYASIMGESTYAGWPGVIVRLSGCPLRCAWCDTPYARERGEDVSLGDIIQRVEKYAYRLVLLTGGEPLAQPGSRYLASALAKMGYQVIIESGGGVSIQGVDPRVCIVLDIKCPDSGMQDRQVWENLNWLKPEDEIKFVIASRRDYEWARSYLRKTGIAERHVVHFSPVEREEEAAGIAATVAGMSLAIEDAGPATAGMAPAIESEKPGDGPGVAAVQEKAASVAKRATTDASERPRSRVLGIRRSELAGWILEDRLPVRLNIQLHVCIWGRGRRGV